jgi:hypothetical protein
MQAGDVAQVVEHLPSKLKALTNRSNGGENDQNSASSLTVERTQYI